MAYSAAREWYGGSSPKDLGVADDPGVHGAAPALVDSKYARGGHASGPVPPSATAPVGIPKSVTFSQACVRERDGATSSMGRQIGSSWGRHGAGLSGVRHVRAARAVGQSYSSATINGGAPEGREGRPLDCSTLRHLQCKRDGHECRRGAHCSGPRMRPHLSTSAVGAELEDGPRVNAIR